CSEFILAAPSDAARVYTLRSGRLSASPKACMSTATEATLASAALDERPFSYQLPAGLMVSSFAALLLELGLTRLFSVVLFYHFSFVGIAIAVLGLGLGVVFAHLGKRWLGRHGARSILAWLGVINGLTIPLVLKVVLQVPVSLELSRGNLLRLTAIYLTS